MHDEYDCWPNSRNRIIFWAMTIGCIWTCIFRNTRCMLFPRFQIEGYWFPISIGTTNRYRPRKYSWIGTDHQVRILYMCARIYMYPRYINHKATRYRRYINPNYVRTLMFAFDNEFGFANARCLCTRVPCISADPTDHVKVRNRVKQTCVRICVRIDHESDSKERSLSRLIIDMHNWYYETYINFGKYWFTEIEEEWRYYIPFIVEYRINWEINLFRLLCIHRVTIIYYILIFKYESLLGKRTSIEKLK